MLKALDLFAGTGWGVACRWLNIREFGVDNAPSVIATRALHGMRTIYHDIWDMLFDAYRLQYDILIASPPCQTFSVAGHGAGRRALNDVLAALERGVYNSAEALYALARIMDDRTALVLTPLAFVMRDLPTYVVFEQVTPVLPVWEAMAVIMRREGYSVWTGILNSEQYGVAQTRRRAVLIARRDGKVARPPMPTHSKFYQHDPARLDDWLLPWVSMADALGWGSTSRPSPTVTGGGTSRGGAEPFGSSAREALYRDRLRGNWIQRGNYSAGAGSRSERTLDQPSLTITSKVFRWSDRPGDITDGIRPTIQEAAILQSYPEDFEFAGGKGEQYQQIGNAVPPLMAGAILSSLLFKRLVRRGS